jgi:hypothetical protein
LGFGFPPFFDPFKGFIWGNLRRGKCIINLDFDVGDLKEYS